MKKSLLYILALLVLGLAPMTAQTAIPSTFFGMHLHNTSHWPSVPFKAMRMASGDSWATINTSENVYNWNGLDNWVNTAQSKGVDVMFPMNRTPQWASSNPTLNCLDGPGQCAPPKSMTYWDEFVRALATRYAGRIKYYELWNEPSNWQYWNGSFSQMVTMAQHANSIIKSIDPGA